ncbi:MAG: sugar ABC transporter permease, partial [Clostridia bacterium]
MEYSTEVIKRKKKFLTLKRKESITGWAFVAPAMIGFLIFTVFSMGFSLYMSFTNYSIIGNYKWVGLQNYINIFTDDPFFWQYLLNTVIYVVLLVPTVLVISLFFAILLNKKVKGWTPFYRACLFLPCIVSTVAVSLVWKWIFSDNIGMLSS